MDAVTDRCAQLRVNLGAYVLGALDAAERAQLEEHLGDCAGCRDELVSLAALPGLLARVDPTVLDGSAVPHGSSAELLAQRAVQELRRRRGLRRPWISGVAVAAVLLGVLAGGARLHDELAGAQTVSASDAAGRVTASVQMRSRESGTAMALRLSGVGEEELCALIAVAADGRRETVATWEASYGGSAEVDGQSALGMADISALEVVTLDGRRLVRVPV